MSKLAVHLLTWNSAKYVPYTFASLRAQTFLDWELLVVDNASTDNTVPLIEQAVRDFPVAVRVVVNKENKGFARGHNEALPGTTSPYVVMLNQDMYVAPECFSQLVDFLDAHPTAAAAAPRLMRWDFKNSSSVGIAHSLTNDIDALGMKLFRNRRVIEQYTGQSWAAVQAQLTQANALEVFGVSGAFPVYRRNAIEAVLLSDKTFFDESHFMYKEDVDVAYRLAQAGFKSYVVLSAVAHHDRTGAGPRELNDYAAATNKRTHNQTVRYYSYKNHLAVLYKNEYWQNFVLDCLWIGWYELKKLLYFALFDRSVLRGLAELWQGRGALKNKRAAVVAMRKISWRQFRSAWLA